MFPMLPILPNYLLYFDSKAQGLMRIFLRCLLFASKYFSHWEFTNLHWMTHLPMIPILAVLRYCLIIFSLEYLALFLNYYSFCLFAAEVEMMVLLHSTSSKVADQYIIAIMDSVLRLALYILSHLLNACFPREGNCNQHCIVRALELDQIHFKKVYLDSDID